MSLHAKGKKRVTIMLQAAVSSIYLAYDVWTSPNHRALFAIVAHFTSKEGRLQNMLLSLQKSIGQHTRYICHALYSQHSISIISKIN